MSTDYINEYVKGVLQGKVSDLSLRPGFQVQPQMSSASDLGSNQPKLVQLSLGLDLEATGTSGPANSIQHGGTHYKSRAIQPWDYVAANGLGFFEGNAIKYITRWRDKGGIEDLKKAQHYLAKLIEVESDALKQ